MNNPPSLNPLLNIDTDSDQFPVLEPEYKKLNQDLVVKGGSWGKRECEGERGFTIFRIVKLSPRNLKPFQAFCLFFFLAHDSRLTAYHLPAPHKKAFVPRRFF